MTDALDLFKQIEADKKTNKNSSVSYATVVDVSSKGVKIVLDGEKSPIDCYFNALCQCDIGNRVYIGKVDGKYLIKGKLYY